MKQFLPIVLVAAIAAHLSHRSAKAIELPQDERIEESLPSASSLKLISLGYRQVVADYYWLRSINHFGTTAMHELLYPNLEPLLRLVLELDPYFAAPYVLAGTGLNMLGMNQTVPVELLEKGVQYRPDSWKIAFLLGFNAYYFLGDYATAARAYAVAAAIPGSPEGTSKLAALMSAEAGEPLVGLRILDSLLETISTDNPKVREEYLLRRDLLVLEVNLDQLGAALERFQKSTGEKARALHELVEQRIIPFVPEGPLGGKYFIDDAGRIATTSEDKRWRLAEEAKGVKITKERPVAASPEDETP